MIALALPMLSLSVAQLLAVLVSPTVPPAAALPALLELAVPAELMTAVYEKVTELFAGSVAVVLRLLPPLVAPVTVAPPVVAVTAKLPLAAPAGRLSAIVAPVAVLGPELLTVMV